MLMTSELKVGTAFMYEGNALIVQKMLGQRSGRSGMVTSLRVKNLVTNSTMDLAIDAGEKFDEVDLEPHVTKLSYIDGDTFVFMDQDTYEQFELPKSDLGDYAGYITPDDDLEVNLTFYEGKPVGIDLPVRVTRTVTYWFFPRTRKELRLIKSYAELYCIVEVKNEKEFWKTDLYVSNACSYHCNVQ